MAIHLHSALYEHEIKPINSLIYIKLQPRKELHSPQSLQPNTSHNRCGGREPLEYYFNLHAFSQLCNERKNVFNASQTCGGPQSNRGRFCECSQDP